MVCISYNNAQMEKKNLRGLIQFLVAGVHNDLMALMNNCMCQSD